MDFVGRNEAVVSEGELGSRPVRIDQVITEIGLKGRWLCGGFGLPTTDQRRQIVQIICAQASLEARHWSAWTTLGDGIVDKGIAGLFQKPRII